MTKNSVLCPANKRAMQFDAGDVLTEAAAIPAWLGAAHGKEGYARDTVLGRKEAEALFYMTSEAWGLCGPFRPVKAKRTTEANR